jgi:formylglycine-generating enzyme required for sulfatase activity
MKRVFFALVLTGIFCTALPGSVLAQEGPALKDIQVEQLAVRSARDNSGHLYSMENPVPLVDFDLGGKTFSSSAGAAWSGKLSIGYTPDAEFTPGIRGTVAFKNISEDTLTLSNIVPLGRGLQKVYITGFGDNGVSRTHLFIPNRQPVNVIVPDNAWELGFSESPLTGPVSLCALVRRSGKNFEKGSRGRFETVLYPGGTVSYTFYADLYTGVWQEGLRRIFQQRSLYDVKNFNDSLYQRKDLEWIRKSYVIHLLMSWDRQFYDDSDHRYHLVDFLKKGMPLYGGDDVVGIWPTWPSLGIDQRNQFDLFRDLPGGLSKIRDIADRFHKMNSHMFICYNPWDESTRGEGHLSGLADIIRETNSDGAVLDTQGSSSHELQAAADSVKSGVIMYPEGMAVPRDMQGVVSGRVHNAIYYPPMLNLNKFIKPEFAIFRVTEVAKEPILREFSLAFFNGYGTEINMFSPGIPANIEDEYKYLGRTTRILRENTANFTAKGYTPLLTTSSDSIWVNAWPLGQKTIYTIYSILPGGYDGPLFTVAPDKDHHLVDIWHHREVNLSGGDPKTWVPARTDAFNASWLGSNNEGAVDCIARFPKLLETSLSGDVLTIGLMQGTEIRVWAGDPAYDKTPVVLHPGQHTLQLSKLFGRYEGKFVIQLFNGTEIMDERVYEIKPGTPRLISQTIPTAREKKTPAGMVKIPEGTFNFHTAHGDDFISYPDFNENTLCNMPAFYMDRFPVTNQQFENFMKATHYKPADPANFLKNWKKGKIPAGQENFPVTYVSYEDANAYAKWAGKRLPSEIEWQYAAQTPNLNEWPWKQKSPVTWTTEEVTGTLTVKRPKGIDPAYCNLGDGKLYAVGKYPKGANPYGLMDLVGCVWQMTHDVYQSGSYRYVMMKGGSYFNPSSSWWYVQGGPRPLYYRQYLLRVSEGFERNATVGFRCVKDAEP